jgi:HSP20 family protein
MVMAIRDLLPRRFNWGKRNVPVRREKSADPISMLQREMNRMFDSFFEDFGLAPWENDDFRFSPQIDIKETGKEIQVIAELPGMDEKDFDISVNDQVLTLRGEKRIEKENHDENYYHVERSYGSFYREIPLPEEVDADKVEAEYKKGVLTIHLPKKPEAERKSRRIHVKVD